MSIFMGLLHGSSYVKDAHNSASSHACFHVHCLCVDARSAPQLTIPSTHNASITPLGLEKYGWIAHDGATFGVQELRDRRYNITTSFAKRPCGGCGHGGDWGVNLRVELLPKPKSAKAEDDDVETSGAEPESRAISVFFYLADEDVSGWSLLDTLDWLVTSGESDYLALTIRRWDLDAGGKTARSAGQRRDPHASCA